MASFLKQARLNDLLLRTGLNDREIGDVLGFSQSTVWRMRNGKISKLDKHIMALEAHLGISGQGASDAEMIADLVGYSRQVPALRETLIALYALMQKNA
jgi:hypothetical protein